MDRPDSGPLCYAGWLTTVVGRSQRGNPGEVMFRRTSLFVLCTLILLCLPAAALADDGLTIAAKQAQIKTVGGLNGQAWNVWSNGDWGDYFHFTKPGAYKFRVRAYGSVCQNIWPDMAFTVNGRIQETLSVPSTKPSDYTFTFQAEAKDY